MQGKKSIIFNNKSKTLKNKDRDTERGTRYQRNYVEILDFAEQNDR
jgi:hypothetical protein